MSKASEWASVKHPWPVSKIVAVCLGGALMVIAAGFFVYGSMQEYPWASIPGAVSATAFVLSIASGVVGAFIDSPSLGLRLRGRVVAVVLGNGGLRLYGADFTAEDALHLATLVSTAFSDDEGGR